MYTWKRTETPQRSKTSRVVGMETCHTAFGAAIEDAGGFEDRRVSHRHWEFAHCVARFAYEPRMEWIRRGYPEHGESVAARIDSEKVLDGVNEALRIVGSGSWLLTSWETTTAPCPNNPSGPAGAFGMLAKRPLPPVGVRTGLERVPSWTEIDKARRLSPPGLLLRR